MSFRLFDVDLSPEDRKALTRGNQALSRLRAARKTQILRNSFPGLVSWALDSFMQYGLWRIVTLGTGMTAEWNKRRFLNCIVLARSVFETVGAWFRVLDDTFRLLPGEEIRKIHDGLMIAMFGSRTMVEDDGALPPAVNVLTGIDRLDKAYPGSRGLYDAICEYVHPNCDGYLLFGEPDHTTSNTELGEHLTTRKDGTLTIATAGAHYLAIADGLLGKYESIFKPKVEVLDRKFGTDWTAWPGEAVETWRRR